MKPLYTELRTSLRVAFDYRGQREPLLRDYFFRAAKHFSPVIAVDTSDGRFYVSTSDQAVGRLTFIHRAPFGVASMTKTFDVLKAHSGDAGVIEGKTIIDVGANVGTTTIPALKTFGMGSSIAFEPAPANVRLLRQNVEANRLDERVAAFELALSDHDGDVAFDLSDSNSGDHRVRLDAVAKTPDAYGEADRDVITVRARRFDSVAASEGVDLEQVGLAWIDAQGHEAQILSGAQALLGKVPLAMEYWPYGLQRSKGLDMLHSLMGDHYSEVIDLGRSDTGSGSHGSRVRDVADLARVYGGLGYTNLLLLP